MKVEFRTKEGMSLLHQSVQEYPSNLILLLPTYNDAIRLIGQTKWYVVTGRSIDFENRLIVMLVEELSIHEVNRNP